MEGPIYDFRELWKAQDRKSMRDLQKNVVEGTYGVVIASLRNSGSCSKGAVEIVSMMKSGIYHHKFGDTALTATNHIIRRALKLEDSGALPSQCASSKLTK